LKLIGLDLCRIIWVAWDLYTVRLSCVTYLATFSEASIQQKEGGSEGMVNTALEGLDCNDASMPPCVSCNVTMRKGE
jgi:hypothetical protein